MFRTDTSIKNNLYYYNSKKSCDFVVSAFIRALK